MTKTKTTDVVDELDDMTSECPTADRDHWYTIAKAEQAAVKAWKQGGEIGERPATPTLDEMTAAYEAAGCAPGSSRPKARTRKTSTGKTQHEHAEFVIDGVSMAGRPRPFTLGYVAWFHTAGIESPDSKRLSTAALRDVLAQLGVDDVAEPGWSVTLPNGKTVAFLVDSEAAAATPRQTEKKRPAVDPAAAEPKSDAKKAPAKKAAASKKTTTAKKATAAKTPSTKKSSKTSANVATNFKRSA